MSASLLPSLSLKRTWASGFRTRLNSWQKRAVRSHTSSSSSGLDSHRREGRAANRGCEWWQKRGWKNDPDLAFPLQRRTSKYAVSPPPPASPLEALLGALPAVPPTPDGKFSSVTRPALSPPEPKLPKQPLRAAGLTRRSWTDQKLRLQDQGQGPCCPLLSSHSVAT